jgi:hypothetical protein
MLDIHDERRRGERIVTRRPCKIYDPRTRKYVAGSTCNVAPGGMLLLVDRSLALRPGDRVYVGVPPRRHALLRSEELVEAGVVRVVERPAGETMFAVRLESAGTGAVRHAA